MAGGIHFAGHDISTEEVTQNARRAATGLVALGAAEGPIALLMRNDVSFLTASEAARRAGAITLPINWHLTADDVAYILDDSGTKILITHEDLWAKIASDLPGGLRSRIKVVLVETPPAIRKAYKIDLNARAPHEDALSWEALIATHEPAEAQIPPKSFPLIYTSGTTGRPKGVQRISAGTPAPVAYDAFFAPDMCTLLATPLYHSAPNRFLQGTFQVGGRLVLPVRFDAGSVLADIAAHRVTTMFVVPAILQRLLRLPQQTRAQHDLSSLRHVVVSGAPCPAELKRAMIAWWGPVIYEYYGSTETSALTFATSADALAKPGTVGRAVKTARVAVLDDQGAPCPPGQRGEIYGRRDDIPDFTYLNAEAARAEAGSGDLVSVGDIGYLDDEGFLFVCDRKTDMIISNGTNIYPAQIEAAIMAHDDVADCAVFGIPDPRAGEAVAAIIATVSGRALTKERLLEFLRQKLATYMLPSLIEQRQDFPRDAAGKIKKRMLRDTFWRDQAQKV